MALGSGLPFPSYVYNNGVNNLSGEMQLGLNGPSCYVFLSFADFAEVFFMFPS